MYVAIYMDNIMIYYVFLIIVAIQANIIILPKKIIRDKVIISKNMNCPKKKNSVNTNKSNIKNKNCIWEKVSALQKFHGGKVPQNQPNTPALPVHQGYTQQKKIFQANI